MNLKSQHHSGSAAQAPACGSTPGGARPPRGVWALSFVEMWERYSFYGLQGILTFYLIYEVSQGGLGLSGAQGAGIVGGYGAAVYLSQLLGAWFGDRVISPRNIVLVGAIVIAAGHVVLATIDGLTGVGIGLAIVAVGTGGLKTNITTMIGILYQSRTSNQRDAGFSYFYMGINLGAVLGPLTTGFAQNQWGFHYGFALAAIVMFASLIQYLVCMRTLPAATAIVKNPLAAPGRLKVFGIALIVIAVIVAAVAFKWMRAENLASIGTALLLVAAATYFLTMCSASTVTAEERRRVIGYIPIFIGGVIYFSLLFQIFTTASILVTERVNLNIGTWTFPAAWVVMAGTAASILIAPFFARTWNRLGERQPTAPTKFAIALFVIGAGFLMLAGLATFYAGRDIPLAFVILSMMVVGCTETLLGPTGLSLASRIGPRAFASQMIGLNFLTLGLGSAASGVLAQLYTSMSEPLFFSLNFGIAALVAVILLLIRRPLNALLTAV